MFYSIKNHDLGDFKNGTDAPEMRLQNDKLHDSTKHGPEGTKYIITVKRREQDNFIIF